MQNLPFVSIIIPCRNEENFIGKCLDSIIANEYPKDKFEILIVDGMSEDGTRKIVQDYVQGYSYIKLIDNPKQVTPSALNIGIKNSQSDLILWLSAHNEYIQEYISRCVNYIQKYDADAVGGIIKPIPRKKGLMGELICKASSHPFGVGKSMHKTGSSSIIWTDTAFGICYKREIFDKIGTFNEKLNRGQDMEFSLRLKKAGFKLLLAPDLVSHYYMRSGIMNFLQHNLKNGIWAILPFKYSPIIPVSWRHLVPLAFVLSIVILGLLSFALHFLLWPFLMILGIYFLGSIYFSAKIATQKKDLKYLFILPLIFASLHISYGLGSLIGVFKLMGSK